MIESIRISTKVATPLRHRVWLPRALLFVCILIIADWEGHMFMGNNARPRRNILLIIIKRPFLFHDLMILTLFLWWLAIGAILARYSLVDALSGSKFEASLQYWLFQLMLFNDAQGDIVLARLYDEDEVFSYRHSRMVIYRVGTIQTAAVSTFHTSKISCWQIFMLPALLIRHRLLPLFHYIAWFDDDAWWFRDDFRALYLIILLNVDFNTKYHFVEYWLGRDVDLCQLQYIFIFITITPHAARHAMRYWFWARRNLSCFSRQAIFQW